MPGIRNFPRPSMWRAPAGACMAEHGATVAILSPSTNTQVSAFAGWPVPSIIVTWSMERDWAWIAAAVRRVKGIDGRRQRLLHSLTSVLQPCEVVGQALPPAILRGLIVE